MSWGLQKRNNAVSYTTTPVNYIVVVNERERKLGHRFSYFAQKALCGLGSRIRDMEAEWRLRVITITISW